jgi:hypothetical protein
MIHYHGIDGMDAKTISVVMPGRHAFCSYEMPANLPYVADICSTFSLDNGAFSAWRQGKAYDFAGYRNWVEEWQNHPAYDFHLIPDVIDGYETANRKLVESWALKGVPVWHMHESFEYLSLLSRAFPKVAIGSSGEYATIGTARWWCRIGEAMEAVCVDGKPICKLHGLRMLRIDIFSNLPFHSADSTVAVRDSKYDVKWKGYNAPKARHTRSLVIADRVEAHQAAPNWKRMARPGNLFC